MYIVVLFMLQCNLFWKTTVMKDHQFWDHILNWKKTLSFKVLILEIDKVSWEIIPVMRDHIKVLILEIDKVSWEIIPVMRDHILVADVAVSQDGFSCILHIHVIS